MIKGSRGISFDGILAPVAQIELEMLKRLVATYVEAAIKATQNMVARDIQYDKVVGDRAIDIRGRLSWGVLFVSVLPEKPSESYMEEYRQFCERHLVEEAWVVYPQAESTSSSLSPRMLFENKIVYGVVKTVSLDHVFEGLTRYFRVVFSFKDKKPVLTLEWKEEASDVMGLVL